MNTSFRAARHDRSPDADAGEWPPSDVRIKLYERALSRDSTNHLLLLDLASEYARHRRTGDVCRMLERAAGLFPSSAMVQLRVAEGYAAANLPQLAIDYYRRSMEINPHQAGADDIMNELARLNEQVQGPIGLAVRKLAPPAE
jgi:hypothetical protein